MIGRRSWLGGAETLEKNHSFFLCQVAQTGNIKYWAHDVNGPPKNRPGRPCATAYSNLLGRARECQKIASDFYLIRLERYWGNSVEGIVKKCAAASRSKVAMQETGLEHGRVAKFKTGGGKPSLQVLLCSLGKEEAITWQETTFWARVRQKYPI